MQTRRTGMLGGSLMLLGAFLVTAALLLQVWAVPKLVRVPLTIDVKNQLEGTGALGGESQPIRVTNYTKADADASDKDYIVWRDASCIVKGKGEDVPECVSADDPEGRLLDASEESYVSHRRTALGTDDPEYVKGEVQPRRGLVGKFPFDSEKKDYQMWDTLLEDTVPVTYEGEDDVDGLATYRYQISFEDKPAEIIADTQGFYSLERTYWVEPVTGAVIKVETHQIRKTEDGEPLIDINIAYTDKTVAKNVADGKKSRSQVMWIKRGIPITGYVVGGLLLALGALLLLARRRHPAAEADLRQPEVATSR